MVRELTFENAIAVGGWDPRYAKVLDVANFESGAVVVIDPNGDGLSDIDLYRRTGAGDLEPAGSGNFSVSLDEDHVFAGGEAAPGTVIRLAYGGVVHEVVTSGRGWWFFMTDFVDWNHPKRLS